MRQFATISSPDPSSTSYGVLHKIVAVTEAIKLHLTVQNFPEQLFMEGIWNDPALFNDKCFRSKGTFDNPLNLRVTPCNHGVYNVLDVLKKCRLFVVDVPHCP